VTDGNTGLNALVGGGVAILTAPIFPVSPIAGGAVAGYLQRGDLKDGAVVGAIAGLIALLPIVLVLGFFGSLFVAGPIVGVPGGFAAVGVLFFIGVFGFLAVYLVGFGALGGVLGVYIATETDLGGRKNAGERG